MGQNLQVLKGAPEVRPGDRVVINLEERIMEIMQIEHGGWNEEMKNYIGQRGRVQRIDSDGDVEIRFRNATFIFNPNTVAKILSVGDIVKISSDREKVQFLQNIHGGWNSRMTTILGEIAQVQHVGKNYNVHVETCGETWELNPLLCTHIKGSEENSRPDDYDDDSDSDDDEATASLLSDYEIPKKLLFKWTELHMSVIKGDEKRVEKVLDKGAIINEIDVLGNTSLHIAVFTKNPRIIKLLLQKKAKVDILNKKNNAPIHEAVRSGHRQCLRELLDSSINIEDEDGDVPLGLAIMKKDSDAIDLLLSHPRIDLMKTNNKSFSAFHLAAQAGDAGTVEKILQMKPTIVDIQKIDGFSALHLAALNDNLGVAKILIQKAKANLNIKTIEGSTPLMLAADQNNFDLVNLLVSEGADINIQDSDGNTALHVAIKSNENPDLLRMNSTGSAINIVIYLVKNGASLSIQNKQRKTPLDMIGDDSMKANLQKEADQSQNLQHKKPCLLCSEMKFLVKFVPCGHLKLCIECNLANGQIKRCMECQMEIIGKIKPETNGKNVDHDLRSLFEAGDQVRVSMNEELFNEQKAKGLVDMKKLLEKIGTVVSDERTDVVKVMFEGIGHFILPEMLTKVFSCGDEVKLLEDFDLLKTLQENHGGWDEEMKKLCGKTGIVMQTEGQCVSVKFNTQTRRINPIACIGLKKPKPVAERDVKDKSCCVFCKKTAYEMLPLQCGHVLCPSCKDLKKCKLC